MKFEYNDGGRSKYFKGYTGDCVTRAVAIALNKDYKEVYNLVSEYNKRDKGTKSARDGVKNTTTRAIMRDLGFKWNPLMGIGTGCKVHMKSEELPKGTIIVKLSGHVACVKDGVLYDTHDCSREGTRCVYGYWKK